MNNVKYARAYTEVLEILKFFPKNDINKIPEENIRFFEKNMDKEYEFHIKPEIELKKQNISMEANAIIVSLFEGYFANEKQREKLDIVLEKNQIKNEALLREKYNPDNILKNRNRIVPQEEKKFEETRMTIVHEEKWLKKIFNLIKNLFKSNRK